MRKYLIIYFVLFLFTSACAQKKDVYEETRQLKKQEVFTYSCKMVNDELVCDSSWRLVEGVHYNNSGDTISTWKFDRYKNSKRILDSTNYTFINGQRRLTFIEHVYDTIQFIYDSNNAMIRECIIDENPRKIEFRGLTHFYFDDDGLLYKTKTIYSIDPTGRFYRRGGFRVPLEVMAGKNNIKTRYYDNSIYDFKIVKEYFFKEKRIARIEFNDKQRPVKNVYYASPPFADSLRRIYHAMDTFQTTIAYKNGREIVKHHHHWAAINSNINIDDMIKITYPITDEDSVIYEAVGDKTFSKHYKGGKLIKEQKLETNISNISYYTYHDKNGEITARSHLYNEPGKDKTLGEAFYAAFDNNPPSGFGVLTRNYQWVIAQLPLGRRNELIPNLQYGKSEIKSKTPQSRAYIKFLGQGYPTSQILVDEQVNDSTYVLYEKIAPFDETTPLKTVYKLRNGKLDKVVDKGKDVDYRSTTPYVVNKDSSTQRVELKMRHEKNREGEKIIKKGTEIRKYNDEGLIAEVSQYGGLFVDERIHSKHVVKYMYEDSKLILKKEQKYNLDNKRKKEYTYEYDYYPDGRVKSQKENIIYYKSPEFQKVQNVSVKTDLEYTYKGDTTIILKKNESYRKEVIVNTYYED